MAKIICVRTVFSMENFFFHQLAKQAKAVKYCNRNSGDWDSIVGMGQAVRG